MEMAFQHCHRDPLPQPGLTPERLQARRQLYAACAVCFVFMAGEVVGKLGSSRHLARSRAFLGEAEEVYGWEGRRVPGLREWEGARTEQRGSGGQGW